MARKSEALNENDAARLGLSEGLCHGALKSTVREESVFPASLFKLFENPVGPAQRGMG